MSRNPAKILISLFLILATLAVYLQVLNHDFIMLDDNMYITDNKHIQDGVTLKNITWAFTNFYDNFWYPLTFLSFMFDFEIYGLNPGGFHLTNLLFHIINTLLLFFILKKMTDSLWRSAFVAFLFALHPLHVESVAWVTERKDVLCAFFGFLTIWAYLYYTEFPSLKRYALMMFVFICGLMSKLMLITLPFALFLLDFWPIGRLNFAQKNQPRSLTGIVWEKVPLLIPVALLSALTILINQQNGDLPSLESLPMGLRLSNALVSYIKYIIKTIWPHTMAILYPYPKSIPIWKAAGAGLLLVSISFFTIKKWKVFPYLSVGWLWYLGTLVPVIGFVGSGPMADRYTYIPLIGLFIMIAWGIPDLMQTWRYKRLIIITSLCVVIPASMLTTWFQVGLWRNSITLFEHTINTTTNNFIIHNNLGNILVEQGRLNEAIDHFLKSMRINQNYCESHYNLGRVMAKIDRIDDAVYYYRKAIRIKPDSEMTYYNLGNMLFKQGKINKAIQKYSTAIKIKPDYAEAHNNIGFALASQGKFEKAIIHYSEAIRIKPDYELAHNNLETASIRLSAKQVRDNTSP